MPVRSLVTTASAAAGAPEISDDGLTVTASVSSLLGITRTPAAGRVASFTV